MSSNELIPLFPSATHPAIPISAQILSTLRHLTGPGKGNDLKPEERAALVGVSALLGCEKIHSKDLPLSSAQKASSVSPAHFRSTLSKCRTLLESIPSPSVSPSKRSTGGSPSKRSSTSTAGNSPSKKSSNSHSTSLGVPEDIDIEESITPSGGVRPEDVLSPLQTPKKKYKFSSGLDISSLVRSPRTPRTYDSVIASPLRQSVTRQPSTKHPQPTTKKQEDHRDEDEQEGNDVERTPSKKNKFIATPGHGRGVDLENPPPASAMRSVQKRRKGEDPSAFFALRPGSGNISHTPNEIGSGGGVEEVEGEGWMHRRPEETHRKNKVRRIDQEGEIRRKRRKEVRKVDWTYKEGVWGGKKEAELDHVWKDLDIWLDKNDMSSIENTPVNGSNAVDILLNLVSGSAKD
ncbi:hypothetical protein L486_05985 [Kwoniella mangroviensis CBS 10435]|uniref:Uncharacterized protein n=1 Tax=Kwoniella mangroviensis CBS 10435 TaxID=1331196 RepID=A0A1B9INF6_9TREE|nr:hypothetical protein L486_05985 [Kwoniella mangroviensis CBS 10435]